LNWKNSVNEAAIFMDGGKIPCLLVENKYDLVDMDTETNKAELDDFAAKNDFIGVFRTSAKTGLNISESMEFLIKNIIQRMEAHGNAFSTDRNTVALDPDKHNPEAMGIRKKDGGKGGKCC